LNQEADVLLLPEMPGVHWSAYDQREAFVDLGIAAFDERRVTFEKAWYQRRHPMWGRIKYLFS